MSLIAFDLDNTILDYTPSLQQIKSDRNDLKELEGTSKLDLKTQVILEFGEDYWTEIQGDLYTNYIRYAKIDKEFIDLLKYLRSIDWRSSIISHKTKLPILGPHLNMRELALVRLEADGIIGLLTDDIHFFETKEEKISYINAIKPKIFVDDLMEILNLLSSDIECLLFSGTAQNGRSKFPVISNWHQVRKYVEVAIQVE